MAAEIRRPDAFSLHGNVTENWRLWKEEFDIYLRAKELVNKPEDVRVAILLNSIGRDARERYNHFTWDAEADRHQYGRVIAKFDEHFRGKRRLMFSRYKFWSYEDPEGQELMEYVTTLRTLADQCEFTERDNMIRDKLVFSLKDLQLKERLLDVDILTLQTTIEKCQSAETTRKEIKLMTEGVKEEKYLEAVKRQKPQQYGTNRRFDDCRNCGTTHQPRSCPAWGKECHICHKFNHFARVCRSGRGTRPYKDTAAVTQENVPSSDEEQLDMGTVVCHSIGAIYNKDAAWWQSIDVAGTKIRFKIDTGAEANIIPQIQWEAINNRPNVNRSNTVLKMIDGARLDHVGKATVTLRANNIEVVEEIFITKRNNVTPLLGLQTAIKLALIQRNRNVSAEISTVQKSLTKSHIMKEYADVFNGDLGKYPDLYKIRLTDDACPRINPPRRIPHMLYAPLKTRLQEMVEIGVIEPVDKPTDWVNSMVVTEKKDASLRICLDPRELNKYFKREHFTIPTFQVSFSLRRIVLVSFS